MYKVYAKRQGVPGSGFFSKEFETLEQANDAVEVLKYRGWAGAYVDSPNEGKEEKKKRAPRKTKKKAEEKPGAQEGGETPSTEKDTSNEQGGGE